jgi:hypothetical protein
LYIQSRFTHRKHNCKLGNKPRRQLHYTFKP